MKEKYDIDEVAKDVLIANILGRYIFEGYFLGGNDN